MASGNERPLETKHPVDMLRTIPGRLGGAHTMG